MTLRGILEEFELVGAARSVDIQMLGPEEVEALRTKSFEAGYSSGWDDAQKAEKEKRAYIHAEFSRCIQDLGFTFHEAADQIRSEVSSLLEAFLDVFLPEILPDLFRDRLRTEILKCAEADFAPPIELLVSSDAVDVFSELLSDRELPEIKIIEEQSLGPNQAFIRLGHQERLVDFDPLIELVRAELAACQIPEGKEIRHG